MISLSVHLTNRKTETAHVLNYGLFKLFIASNSVLHISTTLKETEKERSKSSNYPVAVIDVSKVKSWMSIMVGKNG